MTEDVRLTIEELRLLNQIKEGIKNADRPEKTMDLSISHTDIDTMDSLEALRSYRLVSVVSDTGPMLDGQTFTIGLTSRGERL